MRETIATAAEIREAERDLRDEDVLLPPKPAPKAPSARPARPMRLPRRLVGFAPPVRAAEPAIAPPRAPVSEAAPPAADQGEYGFDDVPPPASLEDYGLPDGEPVDSDTALLVVSDAEQAERDARDDDFMPPERTERVARAPILPGAAVPRVVTQPTDEDEPRRLLPLDEGDIPGRNTTFDLNDFGPEELDADGRPRRGPIGGTVRKPLGPWTGMP